MDRIGADQSEINQMVPCMHCGRAAAPAGISSREKGRRWIERRERNTKGDRMGSGIFARRIASFSALF